MDSILEQPFRAYRSYLRAIMLVRVRRIYAIVVEGYEAVLINSGEGLSLRKLFRPLFDVDAFETHGDGAGEDKDEVMLILAKGDNGGDK